MLNGLQLELPIEEEAEPVKLAPEAEKAADKLLEKIKDDIKHGRPRTNN